MPFKIDGKSKREQCISKILWNKIFMYELRNNNNKYGKSRHVNFLHLTS